MNSTHPGKCAFLYLGILALGLRTVLRLAIMLPHPSWTKLINSKFEFPLQFINGHLERVFKYENEQHNSNYEHSNNNNSTQQNSSGLFLLENVKWKNWNIFRLVILKVIYLLSLQFSGINPMKQILSQP